MLSLQPGLMVAWLIYKCGTNMHLPLSTGVLTMQQHMLKPLCVSRIWMTLPVMVRRSQLTSLCSLAGHGRSGFAVRVSRLVGLGLPQR